MSGPRHLLGIEGMGRAAIESLLARAAELDRLQASSSRPLPLAGRTVANLFFEDSTRTRTSFEIAAKSLGAEVVNWTTKGSSASKGETLLDTARNIDAMGPVAMVVRHASAGVPWLLARHLRCAVINAGDGAHEHPSQALLDAYTLRARLGSLEGKKIAIVGDIAHSRVARSNLHCLTALGARVVLCGPPTLIPAGIEALGAEVTYELAAALESAHAVMALRIQLERMTQSLIPSAREYAKRYGLDAVRSAKLPEGAVVLHPGPINRGVELSSEVADGPRSVVLEQVAAGVAVRRAILEACA